MGRVKDVDGRNGSGHDGMIVGSHRLRPAGEPRPLERGEAEPPGEIVQRAHEGTIILGADEIFHEGAVD